MCTHAPNLAETLGFFPSVFTVYYQVDCAMVLHVNLFFQEEEEDLVESEEDEDQLNGNKAWRKTSKLRPRLSQENP